MFNQKRFIHSLYKLPDWLVWLVFIAVCLFGMAKLTLAQVEKIVSQEQLLLNQRALLIESYLASCMRVVEAMSKTVEEVYLNQQYNRSSPIALSYLKDYPQHDSFAISGIVEDNGAEFLSATLTGTGSTSRIDDDLLNEITASLALNGQFDALTRNNSQFVWAYYTSAREFLFLAPKVSVKDFKFTPLLYQKEYWHLAHPRANPDLKTIITPLYEDLGGKGFMITISKPVVANGVFLGVSSIDIGIETLSSFLSISGAVGESYLIGRHKNIIAKESDTKLNETISIPNHDVRSQLIADQDNWWVELPLVNLELSLIDKLPINRIYWQAFKQTVTIWVFFLLILSLIISQIKLRKALIKVTDIAHLDPLSKLLNRRGLRMQVEKTLNLNSRIQAPWAVMMIDIDHFKQVNDHFGHDIGDQIITKLARELETQARSTDIVCRWGGEEFIVFLFHIEQDDALKLAEHYRTHIASHTHTPDGQSVTVSIGLANAEQGEDLDTVIDRADRHLYFAKHKGRNCVAIKAFS